MHTASEKRGMPLMHQYIHNGNIRGRQEKTRKTVLQEEMLKFLQIW